MTLHRRHLDSPVGRLGLVADDAALVAVLWPNDDRVAFDGEIAEVSQPHPILDPARAQIQEYFAGTRQRFDIPLRLVGTDFQQQVWWSLADIPYGETSTYAKQAAAIGRPKAMRAVGAANGRNPLSIVLPCHRIVGADGSLTGFAGGLDAKRWLLDHEAGAQRLAL